MHVTTKRNISFILFSVLLIFAAEVVFRYMHDLRYDKIADSILFISIFIISLHFIKYKLTAAIVIFYIILSYASQMVSMAIYGYWLPPINFLLVFEKAGEAFRSSQDSLVILLPTLTIITFTSIIFVLNRYRRSEKPTVYADIIIVTLLIIQPIKLYLSPNSTQGDTPSNRYSAIKAGYYANSYLLGRILPDLITNKEYYQSYNADKPLSSDLKRIENIILVMGESLNSDNLSVFGYNRNTTPWLKKMREENKGIIKKTFSNGVFTDITLPSFFNMIPTPNGDQQIASRNTNLFRMAKEHNYETHFYSAQDNDGMTLINKVGLEYIDNYTSSSTLGYDNYTAAYDDELVNFLDSIDFSKSNFIVLHQIGSHSPYSNRVPNYFKPFGTGNYQNDYDNTVLFTDHFLEKTMHKLDSSILNDNWVLIFTSDHGQTVTKKTMGHGSLNIESNYLVPGFIIAKEKSIDENYRKIFENCEKIFHHQLSTYIGRSLGFDVIIPSCKQGIVNGSRMNGSAGYLDIAN